MSTGTPSGPDDQQRAGEPPAVPDEQHDPGAPTGSPHASARGDAHERPPHARQPASIGRRVGAALVDFLGVGILTGILFGVVLGIGGDPDQPMSPTTNYGVSLLSSAIVFVYFVLMESRRGQTVGKMMLGLRVVRDDGGPVDTAIAVRRRFWFFIGSVIPLVWLAPIVSVGILVWLLVTMSQDDRNRGYHDTFAGSMVVDAR